MEDLVEFRNTELPLTVPNLSVDIDHKENADLILDYLTALEVEYVFGVPGGGIEPLYNALSRSINKNSPKAIIARHETGAAFMADGYTRESGRLGVCCATTGPGTTNLLTGVACAYTDNIPMLVISAQTALPTFGHNALQESSCTAVNTVEIFRHCTRYSTLVSHSDQLEKKLLTAISCAFSDTPGPVHLSIPRDILAAPASTKYQNQKLKAYLETATAPSEDLLKTLWKTLSESRGGVFLLGKDSEKAITEILPFARKLNWPILTTPMGKGLIDSNDPLFKGVFGLGGHKNANEIISSNTTQTIVAIGVAFSETSSCGWNKDLLSKKLIHIDQNPERFRQSPMAALHVRGCPQLIFRELNVLRCIDKVKKLANIKATSVEKRPACADVAVYENNLETNLQYLDLQYRTENTSKKINLYEDFKAQELESDPIKPQHLSFKLSQICPPDTRFVADSGNSYLWGIHYWECHHLTDLHKNLFRIGMGFSSMAWAIGAAVGTALANRRRPVVCMTGDGSMLMSGQEITVALQKNLNILFVILNDSAYGMVKHGQRIGGAEEIGFELPSINFASLASSMGVESYRISSVEDLETLNFSKLFNQSRPCVLDVLIDGEERPPMGERMKVLGEK